LHLLECGGVRCGRVGGECVWNNEEQWDEFDQRQKPKVAERRNLTVSSNLIFKIFCRQIFNKNIK
jgi:hypothetical protein